jgi:DegV family protein with EDD domain
MARIAILTDSTAYLPADVCQRYAIDVIPLQISWEGKAYLDGVDLVSGDFYPRLDRASSLPTTSQPAPQAFLDYFEKLAGDYEGIVAPLISSGISGTFAAAQLAMAEFSKVPVQVIDTHATAGGLALIVLAAARFAQGGGSLAETAALAQDVCSKLHTFFMVDTLKYLHKGGRIGGGARFLGSALSIKPILFLNEEGKIDALERVRSKQKALERLAELVEEKAAGQTVHVSVYHASAPEVAAEFLAGLTSRMNCCESLLLELSPVIGAHVGSGTIGVSVYADAV